MTPEEWGKPIDVAEGWIRFVDDAVKASESPIFERVRLCFLTERLLGLPTDFQVESIVPQWSELLDSDCRNCDAEGRRLGAFLLP